MVYQYLTSTAIPLMEFFDAMDSARKSIEHQAYHISEFLTNHEV